MSKSTQNKRICVSVIMPCYNVEKYIDDSLKSVCGQTLRDIEIICIDDGSTDSTGSIIAEYAKKDNRIKVITKENGGQSSARNIGVKKAVGEYLYFMDSDDIIVPETFAEIYEIASKDKLDNVYFNANVFFDPPEIERENSNYTTYYDRFGSYPDVYTGCELFAIMHPQKDYRPSPCLQFIRREFYNAAGLSFREGIILEDNLFTFKCITAAKAVRYIDKVYFNRRVRANSTMSGNAGTRRFDGYFTCLIELLDYVEGKDFGVANEEAAKFILSIYRNAATEYHKLAPDQRMLVMERKTIRDEYLFSMILGNIAGARRPETITACADCEIANSSSYKIGRLITFIPRKIKRMFQCISDHGLRYTLGLAIKKLTRRA